MKATRVILVTMALSVLAAGLGVIGGAAYIETRPKPSPSLHAILHQKLRLTADQTRRIETLELDYAARRKALDAEMRAANAQLAQAYQESHAFTPKAQAAIDRFHHAMAALQAVTFQHVIAMRAMLTPDQQATFDDTVVKSLTTEGS